MNSGRLTRLKAKGWRAGSAAEFLGHAQPEQARLAQVRVVFEGEAGLAVVAFGATREFRSEPFGDRDQLRLLLAQRVVRAHD